MKLNIFRRTTLSVFAIIFNALTFFSCYKEYSEDHRNTSPFAQGTLKDSSGECMHDSAIGNYYNGVRPGADTDYIELKLNITQAGIYNISTDVQNGFRFADSGYVYHKRDTIIHLKPIGIPSASGTTFFTINFNEDVCYCFVHVQ